MDKWKKCAFKTTGILETFRLEEQSTADYSLTCPKDTLPDI